MGPDVEDLFSCTSVHQPVLNLDRSYLIQNFTCQEVKSYIYYRRCFSLKSAQSVCDRELPLLFSDEVFRSGSLIWIVVGVANMSIKIGYV